MSIDLIDEAGSRVRIRNGSTPISVQEATKMLENVRQEKEEAINAQQYEFAAELREREVGLLSKLEGLERDWQGDQEQDQSLVTPDDIAEVLAMWTGIPLSRLQAEETERKKI